MSFSGSIDDPNNLVSVVRDIERGVGGVLFPGFEPECLFSSPQLCCCCCFFFPFFSLSLSTLETWKSIHMSRVACSSKQHRKSVELSCPARAPPKQSIARDLGLGGRGGGALGSEVHLTTCCHIVCTQIYMKLSRQFHAWPDQSVDSSCVLAFSLKRGEHDQRTRWNQRKRIHLG